MMSAWNPILVASYHAHIYYDKDSRGVAEKLRADFLQYKSEEGQDVYIGNMHDKPIGPHTKPMFEIAFKHTKFKAIVTYLMLHRSGLSVLVHPQTDNDLKDHTEHPIWMGTPVPLDISKL